MRNGLLKRRCPKCNGNLLLTKDYEESYLQCLQCGKALYMDDPDAYSDEPFVVSDDEPASLPLSC